MVQRRAPLVAVVVTVTVTVAVAVADADAVTAPRRLPKQGLLDRSRLALPELQAVVAQRQYIALVAAAPLGQRDHVAGADEHGLDQAIHVLLH